MRQNSTVIDDKNYYEFMVDIGEDTVKRVISSIADIYIARYRPVPELNYLAYNTMSVSMFLDTRYSTLYVTYKLDKDRKTALDNIDDKIYRTVNKAIETIQRDYDITVNIVGDPIKQPEFGKDYPIMGSSDLSPDYVIGGRRPYAGFIRVDTEYLWNIIQGPYDRVYPFFIQNKATLEDNIRRNKLTSDEVQEYFDKVVDINWNYIQATPDPDHVKAFKKYISLNKKTFNFTPKIVEDWRQFTIYINVDHDTIAESANSPDHDRGILDHGERIREYIIDWAKKHHKRY